MAWLPGGARRSRLREILGIVLIVIGSLWTLIWGLVWYAMWELAGAGGVGVMALDWRFVVPTALALAVVAVGVGVASVQRRPAAVADGGAREGRRDGGSGARHPSPDERPRGRRERVAIIVVLLVGALIAAASFGDGSDRSEDGSRVEDGSMTTSWTDNVPLYSPAGGWVAVVGFRDGRWAVLAGPVGAAAHWITSSVHGDGGAAWSPDGTQLVYYRLTKDSFELGTDWGTPLWRESEGLYVVNRDGSGMRQLTDGDDVSPCWSADGETIVFERWAESDPSGVYAVAGDGGEPRLLARPGANPACSPSGSTVAYEDGTDAIRMLGLAGGERRVLAVREAASMPAWSPDGTRVAFYAVGGRGHWDSRWDIPLERLEIYIVNADGTKLQRLTRNARLDAVPVWTRDGRIVFKTSRPGGLQLYVMNSDGTRVHPFRALSSAD